MARANLSSADDFSRTTAWIASERSARRKVTCSGSCMALPRFNGWLGPGGECATPQPLHRLLVLDGREVLVELPDRPEPLRGVQADHVVAVAGHLLQPVRRSDGHRD